LKLKGRSDFVIRQEQIFSEDVDEQKSFGFALNMNVFDFSLLLVSANGCLEMLYESLNGLVSADTVGSAT
jgi:hypothetical protein